MVVSVRANMLIGIGEGGLLATEKDFFLITRERLHNKVMKLKGYERGFIKIILLG